MAVRLQVKENKDKIKLNNQLPYLVGNIVEVLDMQPEEDEEASHPTPSVHPLSAGPALVRPSAMQAVLRTPAAAGCRTAGRVSVVHLMHDRILA